MIFFLLKINGYIFDLTAIFTSLIYNQGLPRMTLPTSVGNLKFVDINLKQDFGYTKGLWTI